MSIGELRSYEKSGQNTEKTRTLYQSGSGEEKTITGDSGSIQRLRRVLTGSRNVRTEVPAPKKASSLMFTVRTETTEEMEEKLNQARQEREELYQKELREITSFDFNGKGELRKALEQAEDVARLYIVERRSKFDLPNDEIRLLHPQYAQNSEDNPSESFFSWSGLNVVYVDEKSPLSTAIDVADNLSFASTDYILEYKTGQTDPVYISGLLRGYSETARSGRLLNNGINAWQTAEMYQQMKQMGLFPRETAAKEQELKDDIHTMRAKMEYGCGGYYVALNRAIKSGIPEDLLEANTSSGGWIHRLASARRIARLIGKSMTNAPQPVDEPTMVDMGRKVLEESKYFGNLKAHEVIKQIFGDDADSILTSDGYLDSFNKVHAAIQRVEEREGLVSVNKEIRDAVRALPFWVRRAGTGEILATETPEELLELEETYEMEFAKLSHYDFRQNEDLHGLLIQAEDVGKSYFCKKLSHLGLPVVGVRGLRAQYVESTDDNSAGHISPNGLITIPVREDKPLSTALGTAHEFSHGSSGIILELNEEGTKSAIITGLTRNYKTGESEGYLLDNGIAVWHTAHMYKLFQESGLFPSEIRSRNQDLPLVKLHAPFEIVTSTDELERNYFEAIMRAEACGIPDSLLEPYVYNERAIPEMICIWRVARLAGKSISDPFQPADSQTLAEHGREVLERGKYLGTREPHELIERIFGEDAALFLTKVEHPESFEEINAALQKAEERAGIVPAEAKLAENPHWKAYQRKTADMKRLTEIEKKMGTNSSLDDSELAFLYEKDSPIDGFENSPDPRIEELRSRRNPEEDMPIIFGCEPSQIAHTPSEIRHDTKVYVGSIEADILNRLSDARVEHMYASFPGGKIKMQSIEIGGKTTKQLDDIKFIHYKARDMMRDPDFTTLPAAQMVNIIQVRVQDLGLSGYATIDEIYRRAQELGFELCPAEVGPQYLRQHPDGSVEKSVYIGMKQIDYGNDAHIFKLERDEDGLWLKGDWATPNLMYGSHSEFLFSLPKKSQNSPN